jgi:hypothetical protein
MYLHRNSNVELPEGVGWDDYKRLGIVPSKVTEIKEEVAYWRKSNHIHGWFTNNYDVENCKETELDLDDLKKLP